MTILAIIVLVVIASVFIIFTSRDRAVFGFSNRQSLSHNNVTRDYIELAPKSISSDTAIIVGLHGFSGSARQFGYYTGLHNVVPKSDIILYPEAVEPEKNQKTGWNAGFCCGSGWVQQANDIGFIAELIDSTKQRYNLPNAKVFIVGFSNGAFMAQRIAAERPDIATAFASVSGTIGTAKKTLAPTQPIPILLTHGALDKRVLFDGGTARNDPEFDWISHEETVDVWQSTNKNEAETRSVIYPNDAHKWHDWRLINIWNSAPNGSRQVSEFLDAYR